MHSAGPPGNWNREGTKKRDLGWEKKEEGKYISLSLRIRPERGGVRRRGSLVQRKEAIEKCW